MKREAQVVRQRTSHDFLSWFVLGPFYSSSPLTTLPSTHNNPDKTADQSTKRRASRRDTGPSTRRQAHRQHVDETARQLMRHRAHRRNGGRVDVAPPPPSRAKARRRWLCTRFRPRSSPHHLPRVQKRDGGGFLRSFDSVQASTTSLAQERDGGGILSGFDPFRDSTTSLARKSETEVAF